MRTHLNMAAAAVLWACPAVAQDMTYSFTPTTDCLAQTTSEIDAQKCASRAANACMEQSVDGETTVGMGSCLKLEHDDWDRRLNAAYGLLMARLTAEDEELAALGASAPKQAPALRVMQRAWITFRDAGCDYERSKWGGGTGGGPATLSCLLQETARQAITLEADLNGYGEQICNHEGC